MGNNPNEQLYKIQKSIDAFLKAHKNPLSESEHKVLRDLLSKRAKILSEILGQEVHTVF